MKGTVVYKIGGSTGLTLGKLSVFRKPAEIVHGKTYALCTVVDWGGDASFAAPGDCGALYCVREGAFFVPLAIHVNSDFGRKLSVGVDFARNTELLLGDDGWGFSNPPSSPASPSASR
jgi:hypothetical protein